jgi:hypothetical protein
VLIEKEMMKAKVRDIIDELESDLLEKKIHRVGGEMCRGAWNT